jgi:hypothetical protein
MIGSRCVAACVLLMGALGIALAFGGCGSGDQNTTTDGTAAATPLNSGGEGGQAEGNGSRHSVGAANADAAEAGRSKSKTGGKGSSAETTSHESGEAAPGSSTSHRSTYVKHKLAESCPDGADRTSCEALVEGFLASRDSKSHVVSAPRDCAQAISTADCEATLRAQKASEDTYSVDVQECLDNPTPRCEAVLRPVFEQQYAASHQSGE